MKTKTITNRVPEDLFREINEIGEMEKIDRAEVIRRLLSNAAKHWKMEKALELLRDGKVTVRKAAKIAEVTYVEMLDLSSQMDIVIKMEPEDVINERQDAQTRCSSLWSKSSLGCYANSYSLQREQAHYCSGKINDKSPGRCGTAC